MTYLLDTNVVSEWVKTRSNPGLISWMAETDEGDVFLSVITIATIAELRDGIERMAEGRRSRLEAWLDHARPPRFLDRILGIDEDIAKAWGRIVARRRKAGKPIGAMDGFIAATAMQHGLALVTRDVDDFEGLGLRIVCPWTM